MTTSHTVAEREKEELKNNYENTLGALQMLLELLEEYSPRWYTQEHHDIAARALAKAKKSKSVSSVRHRLKDAA